MSFTAAMTEDGGADGGRGGMMGSLVGRDAAGSLAGSSSLPGDQAAPALLFCAACLPADSPGGVPMERPPSRRHANVDVKIPSHSRARTVAARSIRPCY